VAAIVNDGSVSKPSALFGARHTVDEPSNPAVVADSSRQATDHIVAPAAVCPGIVTRQSCQLFKDNTDQNAVPVRIEKAGLLYNTHTKKIIALNNVFWFHVRRKIIALNVRLKCFEERIGPRQSWNR